jgi:hypothetical protein
MTDALDPYSLHLFGGFPADTVIAVPDEDGRPSVMAFIFDGEYDPFALKFDCDGFVFFETGGAAWLMLSGDQLRAVAGMCTKAKALWAKINELYDDARDEWPGWQHLATVPATPQNPQTD